MDSGDRPHICRNRSEVRVRQILEAVLNGFAHIPRGLRLAVCVSGTQILNQGGGNDLAALTDREIVQLSNYLLAHYGRPGVVVTVAQVAEVRRGGPVSSLVALARMGVAAAALALLLILNFVVVKTRRRGRPSS